MKSTLNAIALSALLSTAQTIYAEDTGGSEPLTLESIKTHINYNGLLLRISNNEERTGEHWLKEALGIDSLNDRVTANETSIADLYIKIDALNAHIVDLQAIIAALNSTDDPGDSGGSATLTPCFSFTNTITEDIIGNDWFDACIAAQGDTIRVVLKDSSDAIVYDSYGAMPAQWNQNQITHSTGGPVQVDYAEHNMIEMANKDQLMITGKNSDPMDFSRCNNAYANGYGIIITSEVTEAAPNITPKLYVLPYNSVIGFDVPTKRNFVSWSEGHEITYNEGGFQGCLYGATNGLIDDGFIGTFEVYIYDSTKP